MHGKKSEASSKMILERPQGSSNESTEIRMTPSEYSIYQISTKISNLDIHRTVFYDRISGGLCRKSVLINHFIFLPLL